MGITSISIDSVPSASFTPQEPLVELLRICLSKSTLPFLAEANDKPFLITWLIKEWVRNAKENQIILLVVGSHEKEDLWQNFLFRLTSFDDEKSENNLKLVVSTSENLVEKVGSKSEISLLIIENAHILMKDENVKGLSKDLDSSRVILLAPNLLRDPDNSRILQPNNLKKVLQCLKAESKELEACSDLLSTLRFFCHPSEQIILNENVKTESFKNDCEAQIDQIIENCYSFLKTHHFSLLEIYGAEFQDLIEDVPDPTVLPLKLLDDFVYVKNRLGLWSAERAALLLIIKIDKLKTREKYERHYLLLSSLYTEMVKIRKICELAFENLSEIEKLTQYSTPQLLRLVQILRQYKPDHVCRPPKISTKPDEPEDQNNPPAAITPIVKRHFRGGRYYKSGYTSYDDPNALCGIIFVENKFLAKLLYHFLKDLSRSDDAYSFLMPQYATDLSEDELEGLDFDVESKRQEDSLRRFRMKECNLLISSSLLELGVDNVRCNLVVSFDIPKTFKQYTSYKVKAKAAKSHFLIFCHEEQKEMVENLLNDFGLSEAILKANCTLPGLGHASGSAKCEAPISEGSDRKFNPFYSINRYCSKLPSDTL